MAGSRTLAEELVKAAAAPVAWPNRLTVWWQWAAGRAPTAPTSFEGAALR